MSLRDELRASRKKIARRQRERAAVDYAPSAQELDDEQQRAGEEVLEGVPRRPRVQPVALLGLLRRHAGPVYLGGSCGAKLHETVAKVSALGGEYFGFIRKSRSADSCCGWNAIVLGTVNPCDGPPCQVDHRVSPGDLEGVAAAAAAAGRFVVSPGWAAALGVAAV
jgi:hypothetical protein